ncbi:hypothetical protein [Arthrobacter sp. HLT1-21]
MLSISLAGNRQITAGLAGLIDGLGNLDEPTAAAARIAATAGRERAPKVSGFLARSISSSGGTVYSNAPYAAVIHWGWAARNIGATHFLSDGATSSEPAWSAEFSEHLEFLINKL